MWRFSKYFIRSSVFFAEIIRVMARISDTIEDIISSIDNRRLLTPNAAIIATIATNIYPNNGSRLLITNYLPSPTSPTWDTSLTRNNQVLGLGITEHVSPAGLIFHVTKEIGFEVEHFQVDIHLISHALGEVGLLA